MTASPTPVLVVTHGRFGEELAAIARELLGPVSNLDALSISATDSLDRVSAKMEKWAANLPRSGRGLILTDLKNSSASVCALGLAKRFPVDCLCGVNLPLLLKALTTEGGGLADILAAGRTGIDAVGKSR